MRLRHLEIFHAVMRTGSISGAADLLNLSQSAASKALVQAEHAVGITLFQRVRGRLVRTREAEQIFAQTSLLFTQAENVQRLVRNLKRNPEDHLRVGCLPSLGLGLIPCALAAFRERCPGVSLELSTGNGDELLERLLVHELDVAVSFDMPLRQGLARLPVGDVPVVHVASEADADAGDCVHLAALDPQRWIGSGGSDPLAQRIRDTCDRLHLPEPSPMIETRTYYIAAALARQGVGFALVDAFTAHAIAHDLRIRPLEPAMVLDVVAFHGVSAMRSVAFDTFIATLQSQFPRS
ncbi:LysR family transcriptional regulator [Variovorax sp. LT1R16]|uniref:LysR family transcriptional regulator n=1 Tax=Variovorax sp. LT1R16 TaxID=3443728 RepID=UPI003F487ADB